MEYSSFLLMNYHALFFKCGLRTILDVFLFTPSFGRYYEGQLADLTELEDDAPELKDSQKLLTEAATEVCMVILLVGFM